MNILSIKTTCIGGFKQDKQAARHNEADFGFATNTYNVSLKTLDKLQGFRKLVSTKDSIGELARSYGVNLPGADAVRILTDDEAMELIPQIEICIRNYIAEAEEFIKQWHVNRRVLIDSCGTAEAQEKMKASVPINAPDLSKFTATYTLLPISETAVGDMLNDELRARAEASYNMATKVLSDSVLDTLREVIEDQYDRINGKDLEGNFKRLTSSHTLKVSKALRKLSTVLKGNVSDPDILRKMEMIDGIMVDRHNDSINEDRDFASDKCWQVLHILAPDSDRVKRHNKDEAEAETMQITDEEVDLEREEQAEQEEQVPSGESSFGDDDDW